ncbi:hypothetical protein PDIG_73800 [Penicillium digitatum PHI26]|uniref:Uncharacterized protein n=1 Tax=Penicillium digitatum (strain PHI26 / CECT 20796) TaxID=1170229 RepID=K9G1F2_PEND2|nr:hypothetical protein PDIG_73800 [Penicillium digitatum PHI26]
MATTKSSSFTLKGIDPDMITNLNTVIPPRESRPPSQASSRGRNRGWSPAPSPDEDHMMSRVSRGRGRPVPAPRGNIRGKDLLVVDQHSLETTIALAPRTRPFHGVLPHQEAVAEAVDRNEEEDSHADRVAAVAEAAGGKKEVR